jgi:hypothetical protein
LELKRRSRATKTAQACFLSTAKKENGIPTAAALPLDGLKRNRPGAVGSEALTWDANGNLLSKGDLRF